MRIRIKIKERVSFRNLGFGRDESPTRPRWSARFGFFGCLGQAALSILFLLLAAMASAPATSFAEAKEVKERGPTETSANERIPWQLPTENRYLFEDQPKKFYQPTISRRLISGTFGFTRTSAPEPARIFERFHKGVDIKPLRRDARGEPLDPVRACADGVVVRVNDQERISDYGKQVIVRHDWGGLDVLTVYAHLGSVRAQVGQTVKAGDVLGILGWTGPGLVQSRAHLHLEVAFQINPKFDEWVKATKPGRLWEPNRHGEWHGLNLMGIDPVPLFWAEHRGKPKTWQEALAVQPGGFIVKVPAPRTRVSWTDWVQAADNCTGAESWQIEMTPWGLPLKVSASATPVTGPELVANPGRPNEGKYYCRGLVEPDGKGGMRLSKFGRQYFDMMMFVPSP